MRYTETTDDSAVSPVIGVILMVAITVILAAVIGTFVLGLGENVGSTSQAGISTSQEANQSVTFTIVDPGNVDAGLVVGPDGNRSATGTVGPDEVLQAGTQVEIQRGGFDNDTLNAGAQGQGPFVTPNQDECRTIHGANVTSGINVGGADIDCAALTLEQEVRANPGLVVDLEEAQTLDPGQRITYQANAEYKLIGIVDGQQQVLESVTTDEG